jgi:hypothetical protein
MKKLLYTLITLTLSIFTFSCKDPVLGPTNYSAFPMDLKVEKLSGNKVRYKWNAVNTSDFIRYIIVRSTKDSVPYFSRPDFVESLENNISVVTAISDSKTNEFIDSINVVIGESSFRIFAFLEDRSLSSINVKLKGFDNMTEVLGATDDVVFAEKLNTLAMANSKSFGVSLFNIVTNQITAAPIRNFSSGTFTNDSDLSFIESNVGNEFFIPTPFNGYNIINLNNSSNSLGVFLPRNSSAISHFNNSWILFSNSNGITSRPRNNISNFNTTEDFTFFFTFNKIPATPVFLRKMNKNKGFYAINTEGGNAIISTFNMGDNGKFSLNKNFRTFPIKGMTKARPFKFSNDDAQFVMDNNGSVLDTVNFTVRKKLAEEVPTSDIIRYSDYQFSSLGTEIYALRVASKNPPERLIDVFKFPECIYVKSIPFYSAPNRFFLSNGNLILVGTSPTDNRFSIIENIKL